MNTREPGYKHHTQAIDRAVTDRIDEVLEFGSPDQRERKVMLQHYFGLYIVSSLIDRVLFPQAKSDQGFRPSYFCRV